MLEAMEKGGRGGAASLTEGGKEEGARGDTRGWRRNYPGEWRGIGKGIPKRRNTKCKAPRANENVYLI